LTFAIHFEDEMFDEYDEDSLKEQLLDIIATARDKDLWALIEVTDEGDEQ